LVITVDDENISYLTCVFLLVRPFILYHELDPLIFDLLFENFILCFNEIFDETKETVPILKPLAGPFLT
jgi:hypothetical protein